jgi:hypothetical protein
MLTTHPLPVPRLGKSRSYTSCHPDAPLWSVTGPLYFLLFMDYIHINFYARPNIMSLFYAKPFSTVKYEDIRDIPETISKWEKWHPYEILKTEVANLNL